MVSIPCELLYVCLFYRARFRWDRGFLDWGQTEGVQGQPGAAMGQYDGSGAGIREAESRTPVIFQGVWRFVYGLGRGDMVPDAEKTPTG